MPVRVRQTSQPPFGALQATTKAIYGLANDRYYDTWELFSNQERFMMRALKGIRKGDPDKLATNLTITFSWFSSLMNRFHIDLDDAVWWRFPGVCSYCGKAPCACRAIKPTSRAVIEPDDSLRPETLADYQRMFADIYPPRSRTLEHAGIHLAEEQGEVSEAIQQYLGSHNKKYFGFLIDESADYVSCVIGVANSAGIELQPAIEEFYRGGCHACHHTPCTCSFLKVSEFKS